MTKQETFIKLLKYLQDILLGLIVVMGLAYAFRGNMTAPETLPPEPAPVVTDISATDALKFAHSIMRVKNEELAQRFVTKDGKPTVMMLYASWCGYCKRMLPQLLDMQKVGQLEGAHLFLLSIDDSASPLATYMLQHGYKGVYEPYIESPKSEMRLADALNNMGSYYSGAIPHTIVFDGQGKLVTELAGFVNKERLLARISSAIK